MRHLKLVRVDTLLKFKLELGEERWESELADNFDECLADTDAHATKEWREAVGVPSGATRSQVELTAFIKAFRDELFWLDPLLWVIAERVHAHCERISLPDLEGAALDSLRHSVCA